MVEISQFPSTAKTTTSRDATVSIVKPPMLIRLPAVRPESTSLQVVAPAMAERSPMAAEKTGSSLTVGVTVAVPVAVAVATRSLARPPEPPPPPPPPPPPSRPMGISVSPYSSFMTSRPMPETAESGQTQIFDAVLGE